MLLLLASHALAQDSDCTGWGWTDPVFGDDPVPWEFRGNGAKLAEGSVPGIRDLGQRAVTNGWRVCVEVVGGNDPSARGAAIRAELEAAGMPHDRTASFGMGRGDSNVRLMIFDPANAQSAKPAPASVATPTAPTVAAVAPPKPAVTPLCTAITQAMEASRANFREWALAEGYKEDGNNLIFQSLYGLPGAHDCDIVQSITGWQYSCQFPLSFPAARDAVAACFPSDAPRQEKVSPAFLSEPETTTFKIGMPGSRHATQPMITVWAQAGAPVEIQLQAPGGLIPMPWE